jgi:hypothetical protein
MSGVDLALAACVLVPLGALVLGLVAVSLVRGRRHRAGMEGYRAACRTAGLERTPEGYRGDRGGTSVATSFVRYKVRTGTDDDGHEGFTRYVARIEPQLDLDLHVFAGATFSTLDGTTARIVSWRRRPLPPPVALVPDPYRGALHAHGGAAAAPRLAEPRVVAALHDALAAAQDLLVTDCEVELLTAPYERSPGDLERRLGIAAALARALATAR